jgi:hypothetical protein
MKQNRSFAVLIFIVILGAGAALVYARYSVGANVEAAGLGVGAFVLALVVASAIQVAEPKKPTDDKTHANEIVNRIRPEALEQAS